MTCDVCECVLQVRASTEIGKGDWSTVVHGFTSEAVPSAPRDLRNVSRTRTSVTLTWDQPESINGVLSGYSVRANVVTTTECTRAIFVARS